MRTAWDELPFESNALDLVVAPFALDRSADPHALLRELERVLVPEGHALFFGFNPWYPWRLLSRHERWPRLPGSMTVPRLKDRLLVLGFEPRGGRFGMYAPPGERLPRAQGFRVHIQPFPEPLSAELDTAVAQINRAMEALIRQCPQQYLWGYGRYKKPRDAAA